jgi:hypothetical protein
MIRSGDEIYLETNDPEGLPLPDWRILDMQWILHRVTALSAAAEPRDDFNKEGDDDWDMALGSEEDLEGEDEWFAYTPSPEKSSPPPVESSPPPTKSLPPSSPPPPFPPLPCHSFFPSATKQVEFGTAITTADESIVSGASEAIDQEAEVKEDTPMDEGKGKRRADSDTVEKFEDREAKKRMVLSGGKC